MFCFLVGESELRGGDEQEGNKCGREFIAEKDRRRRLQQHDETNYSSKENFFTTVQQNNLNTSDTIVSQESFVFLVFSAWVHLFVST